MIRTWLIPLAIAAASLSVRDDAPDGFTKLFDGKSTEGWTPIAGKSGNWVVEDGLLITKCEGGGWLATNEMYEDFELRLEYKLKTAGNSGVFIRSPREGDPAYTGMEIQILDDDAEVYKSLQPYQYCGSVYGVQAAKRGHTKPPGEWNAMTVSAKGTTIKISLNGTVIVDTDLKDHADAEKAHPGVKRNTGHIGLQSHSEPVEFRNISVKVLK